MKEYSGVAFVVPKMEKLLKLEVYASGFLSGTRLLICRYVSHRPGPAWPMIWRCICDANYFCTKRYYGKVSEKKREINSEIREHGIVG